MGEYEFWDRWGLGLTDKQFANAFTALGVLTHEYASAQPPGTDEKEKSPQLNNFNQKFFETILKEALAFTLSKLRSNQYRIPWRFPQREQTVQIGNITINLSSLDPKNLAKLWATTVKSFVYPEPRFQIKWYPPNENVRVWFRLLFEADPEYKAACIDLDVPHTTLHWKLPLHFGYLPGNAAKKIIDDTVFLWPSNKLARSIQIDRDNANCDILVFNGSNSQLLRSLLDLPVPHKCNLFIVRGWLEDNTDMMRYLLGASAAKSKANGFVFVHPDTSDENMAHALNLFIDNLSHNQPVDLALSNAFAVQYHTDPAIFLSRQMANYQIEQLVENTLARMKAMPSRSRIKINTETYRRLNIPQPKMAEEVCSVKKLENKITVNKNKITYVSEDSAASAISDINEALDQVEEPKKAEQKRSQRFLQQQTFIKMKNEFQREKRALLSGIPTLIKVRIGPPDETWESLPGEFPEEKLSPHLEEWNLTVILTESNHLEKPHLTTMKLPKDGPSKACEFIFIPKKHPLFEGRITVLHRGRILQTGVLKAVVVSDISKAHSKAKIEFSERIAVRSHIGDLEKRRQFDVSFLFNHTSDHRPYLTTISANHAWITDIGSSMKIAADINSVISKVKMSLDDYSSGLASQENVDLLIELAQYGSLLYGYIVEEQIMDPSNRAEFADKEYIQIVTTKADSLLPLEFIYDAIAPNNDAKLCPKWIEAVTEKNKKIREEKAKVLLLGKCYEEKNPDHTNKDKDKTNGKEKNCRFRTTEYVCPLGFWGVNKVIERHRYTPALAQPGKEFFLQSEPTKSRSSLNLKGTALVAASIKVKSPRLNPVIEACKRHFDPSSEKVKDWDEWIEFIKEFKPKVLLAMPHTDGQKAKAALEIGGKAIMSTQITKDHVHAADDDSNPLVMLLGCDTVGTALEYGSHISKFRTYGAALVISTIAKVFGDHAATVAEQFINGLKQYQDKPDCIGEIMRSIKRQALLDGLLMPLCVVAFGDADWKLNGEEN